jgi:cytochrome c553
MRDIALYFSIQPFRRDTPKLDVQKVDAGRAKAETENCAACHSTKGKDPNVPSISGQRPLYITRQLQAFASGKRAHKSATMAAKPVEFSDEEAEALGHYFAQAQ